MKLHPPSRSMTLWAAVVAALALGACNRNDERNAGPLGDTSVAGAEHKGDPLRSEPQSTSPSDAVGGPSAASSATEPMAQKTEPVPEPMGSRVSDAAITAGVFAALARDPMLAALKIDVDTAAGRMQLTGAAPDAAARDRATAVAAAVTGVTGVENRLRISG